MDYRTKKINRKTIRFIAEYIRKEFFGSQDKFYFDVIDALEKLPILFENVSVEIVENNSEILSGAPASTTFDEDGNFIIYIQEKVYDKAAKNNNGGYRMHIMHEICHYFLFSLGFYPIFDRAYKNRTLKPFESVEWQAKALAGEILVPFEETKNMELKEIMEKCKVSKDAALYRLSLDSFDKN